MLRNSNTALVFTFAVSALSLGCSKAGADSVEDPSSSTAKGEWAPDPRVGSEDAAPSALEGDWVLVSTEGEIPVPLKGVSLSLRGSRLSFSGGCNGGRGEFSVEEGMLQVAPMVSSMAACVDKTKSEIDDWMGDFLHSTPNAEISEGRLTVSAGGVSLIFQDRESVSPDLPLVTTKWTVDTLIDGQAAEEVITQGVTVQFSENDKVVLAGPCNSGMGSYQQDGNSLEFGALSFTKKACADPERRTLEGRLRKVLAAGSVTFSIEESRLDLERGEIGLSASGE